MITKSGNLNVIYIYSLKGMLTYDKVIKHVP